MQLHETGGDRARLYIPAKIRDEFDLSDKSQISVQIQCNNHQPVAYLIPGDGGQEPGITRPVTIKSNGQAQVDFPRQIAEAMGLLGVELELLSHDSKLVLQHADDE